jgi:SAM-dependent methyltransferase
LITTMQTARVQSPEEFLSFVRSLQIKYQEDWDKRGRELDSTGVYDEIADSLDLNDDSLWIDFCCGTGRLMEEVRKGDHATMVGFDYSIPNLASLHQRLFPNIGGFSTSHITQVQGPPFSYTDVPQIDPKFKVVPHEINALLEDVRTLEVLPQYLERGADVISLTFPGIPKSGTVEGGHVYDSPITDNGAYSEEHQRRRLEWSYLIKPCAEEQAKKILKPGGMFVYATRVGKAKGEPPERELQDICQCADGLEFMDSKVTPLEQTKQYGIRELTTEGSKVDELYMVLARFRKK